jgi:hypothetical protein
MCTHPQTQATNEDDYHERRENFKNARADAYDLGTMMVRVAACMRFARSV